MLTRREILRGSAAPLPPPETTTIRLGTLPCDHPVMASEPFLRQEGFTGIEILGGGQLASGRVDIDVGFGVPAIAALLEAGQRQRSAG